MNEKDLGELIAAQRRLFASGRTLPVDFRLRMLKKLKETLRFHENEVLEALEHDLGKNRFEGYMCEVGMTYAEISYLCRHLRRFAAPGRVRTPLAQFAAKSYSQPSPYGNVLIMSPWNYPLMLTLEPLADAIAAGNTVIVKPSAYSPATSEVVARILGECFPREYVAVVTGGRAENQALLEQKFDMIFFTGSQNVGKEVLRHAAEHLTPAVLELGGKSPCIVDRTANIPLAARRIVFGKFLNAGQTCVAPDYVLCDRRIKDELTQAILTEIERQYGSDTLHNAHYGRIINRKHFSRLLGLVDPDKTVIGGTGDAETLWIAPTVMDMVTWEDKVMQEEIFGPILPILTYDKLPQAVKDLADKPKPLALYFFSENPKHIRHVMEECRFGGGCVNDTIIHLATSEMGFGGVGESGMGSYHGRAGFDCFTHYKSIVDKGTLIDLPMRYQPSTRLNEKLISLFLR
ncbi:MAG: aldehyde dehydrogenase [Firmicutes bacterium]|nr:aldehyde dehydrogenase [Bacillota bacterium]